MALNSNKHIQNSSISNYQIDKNNKSMQTNIMCKNEVRPCFRETFTRDYQGREHKLHKIYINAHVKKKL